VTGKLIATVLFSFLLISTVASGAYLIVPDNFATIQDALGAAATGDTIIVRAGNYNERIDFLGKAVVVTSEEGAAVTTINGSGLGSVVTFQSGEGAATVLNGFTLTGGSASSGGGVFCKGSSPTITNNVITGNVALLFGAGIYCENASPTISANDISGNSSDDRGGGIACELASAPLIKGNSFKENSGYYSGGGINCDHGASPVIVSNLFRGNTTYAFGAAILSDESSPVILSNRFHGNSARQSGGAVYMHESDSRIENNILTGNDASLFGGAFVFDGTSTLLLSNNTIVNNEAAMSGGGMHLWDAAFVTVFNTVLWGNKASWGPQISLENWTRPSTVTIDYSDVQGGQNLVKVEQNCVLNWGPNMIDAEPLFVDAAGEDLHLTFQSPCRDTGVGIPATEPEDFEGDPRIALAAIDMGADEFYPHLYHGGEVGPGKTVLFKAIGMPGAGVALLQGAGFRDPPLSTSFGDLYLKLPVFSYRQGGIPNNGYYEVAYVMPAWLPVGKKLYYQLISNWRLTNPMVLTSE
jgi:predicted outer membrane repeat protein